MKIQREQPPFSTISGTSVRLSERDTIAIYRRGGLSWVAHFRDGYGELNDAATWFRAHAGLLRSSRVGSVAALDTVEMLTPEMISNIARLHQRVDTKRVHDGATFTSPAVAFGQACAQMLCALQGWRIRRLRRAG
jgi:hypothetical protein